jgi:hypothetical protein
MHESRSAEAAAFSGTFATRIMPRTPSLELSVLPSGGGQSIQPETSRSIDRHDVDETVP